MKPFVRAIVAAVILLLPFVALYQWQMEKAVPVTQQPIGSYNGHAEILRPGATDWLTGSAGDLHVGDTLHAVDNVRLVFHEGTQVDLDPAATVSVMLASPDDGRLTLGQQAGRLYVNTTNPRFALEAPALALNVEQARFRVDVGPGNDSSVLTQQGLVYGQTGGDIVPVAAGEVLRSGVGQRAVRQQSTPIVLPPPPPPPPRTPTPTVTPVPPTQPPQRVHIIAPGDTLTYLAGLYNVSVEDIVKANNVENPQFLLVGQKLIIPPARK